ncbi:MAG TPA: toll/interleukin-1 receptor domain-containing protein [Chthoniobacterales bacterium]|jgi:hypothetical protein|nr:toll/interleukin-1 receptor domain-containing protein [Chthoniobacterales bacterium]
MSIDPSSVAQPMGATEKDAYICYNKADLAWVTKLAEHLESETFDGTSESRRLRVFFDKWDIEDAQSLIDRMNQGMEQSRHLIAILSPEFLLNDWPRFEWKHIVAADPNNTKGKLIPCLLRDLSLDQQHRINYPAPFRDLKYIDFRTPSEFKRSFNRLVRKIRNLPPDRGRRLRPIASTGVVLPTEGPPDVAWLPDSIAETIFSNLFRFTDVPMYIWNAATPYSEKAAIWENVPDCSPFILRGGRLYTFARLEVDNEPLRDVVDCHTISRDSRAEWALKADRQNWLMALLNTAVNNHLRRRNIRTDGKGRYYFKASEHQRDRKWPMPVGKPRTVAKQIVDEVKGSAFWVHQGAEIRCRRIDEKIFISVLPLYLFTEDGSIAIGGKAAGKLAQMWMGKQQNPDIFRDVLFWGHVLSDGWPKMRIDTGADPIYVDSTPAAARVGHGVSFDQINIRTLLQHKDSELEDVAVQAGELEPLAESEEDAHE